MMTMKHLYNSLPLYLDGDRRLSQPLERSITALGVAVKLDAESNITITNYSRVAGIALTQGYEWKISKTTRLSTGVNSSEVLDNTITCV